MKTPPLFEVLIELSAGVLVAASSFFMFPMQPVDTTTTLQDQPVIVQSNPMRWILVGVGAGLIGKALWGWNQIQAEADLLEVREQVRREFQSYQQLPAEIEPPTRSVQPPQRFVEDEDDVEDELPMQMPSVPAPAPQPKDPSQIDPTMDFESRKRAYWLILSAQIKQLLQPSAILVKGAQGCGKTTFASYLILLRALYCDHSLEVNDPHAHQNKDKYYNCVLYGAIDERTGQNYAAIGDRLVAFRERLSTKTESSRPHTTIWDEVTNYSTRIPDGVADDFLLTCLSDTRKAREYPVLISHNERKDGLGGGKKSGFDEMKDQLLTVQLRVRRDELGEPRPAFKGFVRGLQEDSDGNPIKEALELHPWMSPHTLIRLFPELAKPAELVCDQFSAAFNRAKQTYYPEN